MLLDRIEYRGGWPRIAGNSPTESIQRAPVLAQPIPSSRR